jgi:YD repeat-containing protein
MVDLVKIFTNHLYMKHTYLFRKTSLSAKLIFLWIIVCLALVVPLKNAKADDQAETPLVSSDTPASDSQSIIEQKPQSEISKEPTANLQNEQENILPDSTSAINADAKTENKPEPEKPKEGNQEPESQRLNEDQTSSGTGTGQSKSNQPSVDQASGALQYSFPIVIPPGRSGLQPDLKLSYSSQSSDENGAFGLGWNIGLPSISRVNKTGSQQLYTQNNFSSSLSGELVDLGSGNFGSKIDNGEFLSYTFANNSWTVKDKKGVVYKFGSVTSSRQDDPADSTRVYQWMIEEVRDTNDNYLRYEYFKNAGEVYPARVVYTGSGNSDGIFSIDFFREGRTDSVEHYRPGFKVVTNFRINRIETSVLGSWVRKYDLAYGVGNDGSSSRLNSIAESSGAVISLPPVSFNYQASTGQFTEETSSWQLPDIYFNRYYNGADKGGRFMDVNGDSLQDLVVAHNDGATNDKRIFLNTGSGWSETSSWQIPSDIWLTQSNERDTGWRIADINGDMLADFIISYDMGGGVSDGRVYLNNGVNGWTLQTNNWSIPGIFFAQSNNTDPGGRMADINSDGLPDLFMAHYIPTNSSGPITDWRVYLNTGSGWTQSTAWIFPEDFHISNYYNSKDQGTRMLDINSDGLLDAVTNYEESPSLFKRRVYINTGSGWVLDNKWTLPDDAVFTNWNGRDFGWRTIDINSDGRVDLVKSQLESGVVVKKIYLNNGTSGFVDATSSFQFPDVHFSTYQYGWDTGLRDADVSGDGLVDLVWSQHENAGGHIQKVFTHNGLKPNLLNQILYSTGAATSIQYQNSSQYRDSGSQSLNPQLPTNLFTVKQLSHNSGFGNVSTIDYSYEQGKYFYGSPQNRKFAGFGKITKTNSTGTQEASYFHQGDPSTSSGQAALGEYADHESKIGKMYRTEIRNSGGQLYSANINRFDSRDLGNGRNFIYQMQTVNQVWDGLSVHTDAAESFAYEDFGNITFHTQWGEVSSSSDGSFSDIGSDKRVGAMFYNHNGDSYLHSHLNNQLLYDFYGTKVSEQKIYYDGLVSLGSVTKGNPTRQENWVSGLNYIATSIGYSPQGLPTVTTDPRGYQTTISYDAYNLYPASITNPLNQVVVKQYDYSAGKEKQVTDANSFTHTISYDGLDRPREEKQPDQVTPAQLVLAKSYSYGDSPLQNFVAATEYLSDTISKTSYEYLDGFGRVVQARVQSGDSQYTTADTEYNSTGNIGRSSLPYFSAGSSRTQATFDNSLYTNYQYDTLGRATSQTNVLGTLTTSFEGLKTVVTDQRGKSKRYYNDAFGKLVRVEEINNSEVYTTAYQYNLLGKLVKVTDANGNIRHFSYDALGNRLLAQDLHSASDVSFGSWAYVYDANNNLIPVCLWKICIAHLGWLSGKLRLSEELRFKLTIVISVVGKWSP